ncbi:hypothetical protein NCC49_003767 [Naganishia albida]|nr:hypothetical protein NCC49_003767 [Naganishia albida]
MTRHITLPVILSFILLVLQQVQAIPRNWTAPRQRPARLHSRATTIPNGWAYTDCVSDSGNPRGLQGYTFDSSTMTVNLCITTCQSKGFKLAGLQYGRQCYCGNAMSAGTGASTTGCTMPCAGASDEQCGNGYKSSLYTSVSSVVSPLGCYKDSTPRILPDYSYKSSSMTPLLCQSTCMSKGYSFAGVSYGSECYCGSAAPDATAKTANTDCAQKCAGSTATCGGAWRTYVYAINDTPVAAPSPSTTSVAPSTTTKAPSPTTGAPASTGLVALGCYQDNGSNRLMSYSALSSGSMTPSLCQSTCQGKGYDYAGVSYGRECWCSDTAPAASAKTSDSDCSMACAGDAKLLCGNSWKLNVWKLPATPISTSVKPTTAAPTTTKASTTVKPSSTTSVAPSPTATVGSTCIAKDTREKKVWAHHIVGNTYPYTKDDWRRDIQLAQANGIDGFALNFGLDYWQPARIADAYAVAAELGSSFKLFLSPDMDVIECVSANNLGLIQNYISTYSNHSAAARYGGKALLSSFAGQNCRFGQSSMNAGWSYSVSFDSSGPLQTYFIPAWTEDPSRFGGYDMDGFVNWDAGWPKSTGDIDLTADKAAMSALGSARRLVAAVSPIFFTHFSWKNWLYRSDDFMMSQKLEQLLCIRNQLDQIEIISWNDYGEAHYIGDIAGDQPPESRLYTTGIPHTDILPLVKYYATAWKTGAYPKITTDQVFVMARPHPAAAGASGDNIGAPTGRDRTQDNFYAQVHLTAPAVVYLKTKSETTTFNGVAGVNRFEAPLEVGSGVEVLVGRNGQSVASVTIPDYTFTANPVRYNFNYYIASSG